MLLLVMIVDVVVVVVIGGAGVAGCCGGGAGVVGDAVVSPLPAPGRRRMAAAGSGVRRRVVPGVLQVLAVRR